MCVLDMRGHVCVCQGSCMCVLEVMYVCVRGHVYVCQRSCMCVRGHVCVCQRLCMYMLEVMYMCARGHVYVCQRSCMCVLGVLILSLSTICLLDFGIKRRYQIQCAQRVSGITFIRYAQNRKVGKPNNLKSLASR